MKGRFSFGRLELVIALLGAATLAAVGGMVTGTRRVLTVRPQLDRAGMPATQLWFTPAGQLAAAWSEQNRLRVEVITTDGDIALTRDTPLPSAPLSFSGDAISVFWRDARTLHWRTLRTQAGSELAAPADRPLAGHAVLDDGTVALLLATGEVDFRPPGERTGVVRKPEIPGATQIVAKGPYLAVSSATEWAVYRLYPNGDWRFDRRGTLPDIAQIAVSGLGRLAVRTTDGWQTADGKPLPVRAVDALAFGRDDGIFAAGEFDGIVQLQPGQPPARMTGIAGRVIALAANDEYLAFSDDTGTHIHNFFFATQITDRGYQLAWLTGGLTGLAIVVPVIGWLHGRVAGRRKARAFRRGWLNESPDVPDALVDAIVARRCVLYAGDHLGAVAGYPTWEEFSQYAIEWVERKKLVPAEPLAILRKRAEEDPHHATDGLARAEVLRDRFTEFHREVFEAEVPPSTAHDALRRFPFAGLIESGGDFALAPIAGEHDAEPLTPRHPGFPAAVRDGRFFRMRLRGLYTSAGDSALSRAEMRNQIRASAPYAEAMALLATSRTILFLGITLEDLDGEIGHLHLPKEQPHFAYVPGRQTEKEREIAARLSENYGIVVTTYAADLGAGALVPLIELLLESVELAAETQPSRRRQK